ncbi:MAG: M13 family metallopeptidase [Proteobacteria bacterium]|nr:M13 family metallopeptidase [Pseudomonadota bacterium]
MRFRSIVLASAAFALLTGGAIAAATVHGIDTAAMDTSIKPGDDFYDYANGNWMKTAVIPPDLSSWGSFAMLAREVQLRNRGLMEEAGNAPEGSEARKVGDYYASFMDEAAIEKAGLTPLKSELDRIAAIKDAKEFAAEIGASQRIDVDPLNNTNFHTDHLFGIWVAPGFNDPTHYTPYMLQGGIGLPDRDYYLTGNAKMADIRTKYIAHIARVLTLMGMAEPAKKAQAIFDLEKKIADAQESRVDSEDILKANNAWKRADFAAKAQGFDWDAYFDAAGLSRQNNFIVWQPAAISSIASIVKITPIPAWRDYLAYHAVDDRSAFLPKAFADERFAFYSRTLSGTPQQAERWKRAVNATNAALGDAVGQLYVKRYFPASAKAKAVEIVSNLKTALKHRIDRLDWMNPATRAKAKEKVDAFYVGVGYPEKWRSYSAVKIVKGDALGNQLRAEEADYRYWTGRLGQTVDRGEWSMTPQTVNAVNLPLQNAVNIPAAILQPPFFDPDAPAAVNYGAIGVTMGHEITHSFDNQGAQFGPHGELTNWWTKQDFAHFTAAGDRLAKQYDGYKPFPDLAVNGKLTLGENIADLGGLNAAHDAWLASLHGKPAPMQAGFTGEQQFFLGYATVWRTKMREAALRRQILTNEHAPGQYRADNVRNVDAWYKAFDVKPGETLYLPPQSRVHIW